ncbi:hypothetical protein [Exiguobacterium sp. S3]|uniref:hypothetical protein n=1 Tax=Exiguobacterium sp. S3 TaxID=483245 RepID=UPI001BE6894B|nr:hypothetical protein [Exiguobacterium sp. S3]
MAKTVYFYRFNVYSFDNNTQQTITVDRARRQLNRFVAGLPYEERFNEADVAATLETLDDDPEVEVDIREEPIHLFQNRAEDGDIFWEVIRRNETYIFGLLGKNIDTYLHLRNRNTRRSREIAREEDEQIEATTFFVINLEDMVCAFFREQGAPVIEEMNKLFYRVPGFENFQVNMVRMTNAEVLESIARKDVIASLEYEIEVPQERFFRYIGVSRDDALRIRNLGSTKMVVKLSSTGRNNSLLQDSHYEEKVGFLTRFGRLLRRRDNNAKAIIGAKDDGERKTEYSFLDDEINLKTIKDIDYREVLQIHRGTPDRPYSEVLFEYFEGKLLEALEEI